MTLKEELNKYINNLRSQAGKSRTVYGYDIIKAVDVAFKMAKDNGHEGDKTAITNDLLHTLFGQDFVFDVLHAKAKEEYEKIMKADGFADNLIEIFSDLFDDEESGSDDDKEKEINIAEMVADLFGVKKEDKE